ncbi:MAG: hypothetical protein JW995_11490, partial [Melioribacteraceae bacterium]|nr:hypothetical protein [Melioribacteraceae bacterium]
MKGVVSAFSSESGSIIKFEFVSIVIEIISLCPAALISSIEAVTGSYLADLVAEYIYDLLLEKPRLSN